MCHILFFQCFFCDKMKIVNKDEPINIIYIFFLNDRIVSIWTKSDVTKIPTCMSYFLVCIHNVYINHFQVISRAFGFMLFWDMVGEQYIRSLRGLLCVV